MKKISIIIGFIVSFALAFIAPFQTFAAYDPQFYSSNNILFYNPDETTCSTDSTGGASGSTSLSGSDNEQKIYNFWVGQGLTPAQAAGITGNTQAESGFSPFRQEELQTWPAGGYGIAQFTGGQRTAITTALSTLGTTFTTYYSNQYGGAVDASTGFVPSGVPSDVNDQFLLSELNYLASYISQFAPSTIPIRVSKLQSEQSLSIPSGMKLMDYIKTLSSASDAAKAWEYLYEYPGNLSGTAVVRASNAETILQKYTGQSDTGSSSTSPDGCANTAGGVVNCPSTTTSSLTTGGGSTTAIVSTAECLSFSTRDQGVKACNPAQDGTDDINAHCVGPTAPANYAAARRQYKTAGSSGTDDSFDNYGGDCGNFVATVMRMSGADPNYPISGVGDQYDYMAAHPEKYQNMGLMSTTTNLQPGDIMTEVGNGHITIYTGNGQTAQASQGEMMPVQEPFWMTGYVWRLKS